MNTDEIFGPRKIKISDIGIQTAGAFISGVIGSIVLLFIIFLLSGMVDVPGGFKEVNVGMGKSNPMFPFILSFVTFIASIIVGGLTYFFFTLTDGEKYKRTIIHFSQISFFSIITYIFFAPIYVYAGMQNYDYIMYIFIIHTLLLGFGVNLILEVMNNFRYILLGIYACFIGLFLSGMINILIFSSFSSGYAKLLSLLFILPLINGLIVFFKGLFEMIYYKYFLATGRDQLGDIFKQIEDEEIEAYQDAVNQNNTY